VHIHGSRTQFIDAITEFNVHLLVHF